MFDSIKENEKLESFLEYLEVPDANLLGVPFVDLKEEKDFKLLPTSFGCYWIATTAPCCHSLHNDPFPEKINNREIIYNGTIQSKGGIRARVRTHLLRKNSLQKPNEKQNQGGTSAVSMDICSGKPYTSHAKFALYNGQGIKKIPYINGKRIKKYEQLFEIYLSEEERVIITNAKEHGLDVQFENGINIFSEKYSRFEFRVFYIPDIHPLFIYFIETEWRKKYGTPRLCSMGKR